MTYEVEITAAAVRDLSSAKTPRHIVDAVVALMEGPLAEIPRRVGKPLLAPLQGVWSARRGDFRVLYLVQEDPPLVSIVAVKHRADSYRLRRAH